MLDFDVHIELDLDFNVLIVPDTNSDNHRRRLQR